MKRVSIPLSDVAFSPYSSVDTVGKIFYWQGRVFRAINEESVLFVKALLRSTFFKQLVTRRLFPRTRITDLYLAGYSMVVEHERITTVTYPYEWSFRQLQRAALCVLQVNVLAKRYGYQTKDCHGYNVLFQDTHPYFVDLGSFVLREKNDNGWVASDEFNRYYLYPLQLWAQGWSTIAQNILANSGQAINHAEYLKIVSPLLRLIPQSAWNIFSTYYFSFSRLSSIDEGLIQQKLDTRLFAVFSFMKRKGLLPFQTFDFQKAMSSVIKLKQSTRGYWSVYQSQEKSPMHDKRFLRIAQEMSSVQPKLVLDMAGNEGVFSRLLLKKKAAQKVVCVDYDEGAINRLAKSLEVHSARIVPIVANAIFPRVVYPDAPLWERYKPDALVVLALTHHLALTQGISFQTQMTVFARYNAPWIFIEFMPLGLFNGTYAPPLPDWYNESVFLSAFEQHYLLKKKIVLEKNRILFIGTRKSV